ncbi:helix-hairpin-helix domain-containing protein [Aureibacter tunicatorum]|uniref:Serine/threonine protein kinase n=1 Tax=Aureibacter tunicatorum TaxID=866807 RepID=A0AAE3XPQ6_9BACT|nr:lipopolysaccharide kinase InaA family protein [Aureibacter tunicatorum]MDR6240408.1 serine/threonine protein kinase [Aureibacter tunicatorum]BDD05712.1 kinase [Aureibacter tunicatorum]
MARECSVKSIISGEAVTYIDEIIGQGAMKDVYFSKDKSYVVGFFRTKLDEASQNRLLDIVGPYRDRIFNQPGGEYWKSVFCWPYDIVESDGLWGVVTPVFQSHFFFDHGSVNEDMLGIRGKEKEGKWFASGSHQNRFLDPREKGDLLSYLRICLLISRAVRRLHAAGLAHSDLSYKNVLIDPKGRNACIIDIDGLVVPGKYPPDVIGTPDFIAPEVIISKHLPMEQRVLPSIYTDRHALAVLIYMYLFFRHPLRGGKVHDMDAALDEEMTMGNKALFIEHPMDKTNRPKLDQIKKSELPYADVGALPYTIAGPYLKELFDKAFITGLHDPEKRPTADEWEQALVKTVDFIQPCSNQNCSHHWFVFDNKFKPVCHYCGTHYEGELPVFTFYSSRDGESFTDDKHRLMIYHNQYLYKWHVNRLVSPNEKLSDDDKAPLAYFSLHNGKWMMVNQSIGFLKDIDEKKVIKKGEGVYLKDGQRLLLSEETGGRLAYVQIANKK